MNYLALLANSPCIHLVNNVLLKTNARYNAENSLIALMAQIMVIAMTHFYPGKGK